MFEELDGYIGEISEALTSIKEKLGIVRIANVFDASEVERALTDMEGIIDSRLSEYIDNPAVAQLATEMKAGYREKILEAVEAQKAKAASHKPQAKPLPTNLNPAWPDMLGPSCRSINPITFPIGTGRPPAIPFEWPYPPRFRKRRP